MCADDEYAMPVEIERAVVQMTVGVEIIGVAFLLEPAEQPPFGRGEMARLPALDGVGALHVGGYVVVRLGPIEGERRELRSALPFAVVRELVARQVGLRVDDGA